MNNEKIVKQLAVLDMEITSINAEFDAIINGMGGVYNREYIRFQKERIVKNSARLKAAKEELHGISMQIHSGGTGKRTRHSG